MDALYEDYKKFENIIKMLNDNSNFIDASEEIELNPTTLIPLLCESKKRKLPVILNENVDDEVKDIFQGNILSGNVPFQILPYSAKESQKNQLSDKLSEKINSLYGGGYTLRYIFSELIYNIYSHTSFEEKLATQGYVYAKEYSDNVLDICIMDDGLSIPGRFSKSGKSFRNECHAIEIAISNNSTISDDGYERGNGLWSTLKLVVEENNGQALIISNKGCLNILNKKKYKYSISDNNGIFKGTLISLRLNKFEIQNFHDCIFQFGTNPYKL